MMGYGSGDYSTSYRQANVQKSSRIWLDEVRCTGTESHIKDCRRNDWGVNDCRHYEDVAIKCLFINGEDLIFTEYWKRII